MNDRQGDVSLHTLLEVSQALAETLELERAFDRALTLLAGAMGAVRASIALLDEDTREIGVVASVGFEVDPAAVRFHLGEGVTGRVVETGKPIVVPRVSAEPMFLARAGRAPAPGGPELTFLCVALLGRERSLGAFSVLVPELEGEALQSAAKLVRIVGAMLSQRLRVHRLVEAERRRLLDENEHLLLELRERYDYANIVGNSGPMQRVYEQIAQVARASTTVLVRGESGTGKELIAHAIHYHSPRAKKPFVKVSCAALPETLVESELFGHERGAFTGATSRKKGRFELADGGTLFLDEVGDLSPATQVKLLRVLQEREFERLGGTETLKVDVRVIAATNRDMEKAIAEGAYREDLHYRLNVFPIFVPPLRERRADVILLADHFVTKFAKAQNKTIKRISTPAIDMLASYHWPGNVRELENTIERAVLVCDGRVIHAHHLSPALQTAEASGTTLDVRLSDAVGNYERSLIEDALKTAHGNRAKAARMLGTTERILSYKVRKYAIDCARYAS